MLGVEFNAEIKELVQICIQKGLLLIGAGPRVVRFVPPLNINQKDINLAVAIFKEALQEWK
jgi:acetylornithine/succinyldiaminopimelate/putrescine aminotransferase